MYNRFIIKQLITLSFLVCIPMSNIYAQFVDVETSKVAAKAWLKNSSKSGFTISGDAITMKSNDNVIAYRYKLEPVGFVVVTADRSLTPILTYSYTNKYVNNEENPLEQIIYHDLTSRLGSLSEYSDELRTTNNNKWNDLISGVKSGFDFEQWPPEGTTSTGGWLETEWSQESPYNYFCPMDLVEGSRSIAGCPSIAISMIINFTNTINGMRFTEDERYYHNYGGNGFWIDDDHVTYDFLSFEALNDYHDSIEMYFNNNQPLKYDQIAALIFGCGVAARQVYSAGMSGTFGVDQAFDALQLYGFGDAELIYDADTTFYTQMKDNIKSEMPVLLAVLVANGPGGHNLVADGYNTDNFYHLNFGWGGLYNGWYHVPEGLPYNLTVIEGAIVDIGTRQVSVNELKKDDMCTMNVLYGGSGNPVMVDIALKDSQNTEIEVFNSNGSKLCTLQKGRLPAGEHRFNWTGNNSKGVFLVVARGDFGMVTKKVIIL